MQEISQESCPQGVDRRTVRHMAVTDAAPALDHRVVLRNTIRSLMGLTRTTQTALANLLGFGQSQLSKRLKRDGVPFSEDELETIAAYFRLDSPADLYNTERAVSLCSERFPMSRCFAVSPGQGTFWPSLVAA